MKRFGRVIVGVCLGEWLDLLGEDQPDDRTRLALSRGEWLARGGGAELRLVAVIYLPVTVEPAWRHTAGPNDRPIVKRALDCLEQLAGTARDAGVATSVEVRFGQATEQLLEAVDQWNADLLVVGGAGSKNALGLMGSTSTQLFRRAPCTVWIARKGTEHDFRDALAAVSLDDRVHGVLAVAASFAAAVDSRLHVLNVVEDEAPESLVAARQALAEWTAPHAEDVRLGTVEAIAGEPAAVILEEAARLQAEIVFIGPSRRSALASYLTGQPSAAILKRLNCSLVCARR